MTMQQCKVLAALCHCWQRDYGTIVRVNVDIEEETMIVQLMSATEDSGKIFFDPNGILVA